MVWFFSTFSFQTIRIEDVENVKFGQLSRVAHRNSLMMFSMFGQVELECPLKCIIDVVHV